MTTIDSKELVIVQKFRKRVTDVVPPENLKDDHYLIRWLRAREFDLDKAELMLRRSMAWTIRNELHTLLDWKPVHNYFRYAHLGSDSEGSPIFICPMGVWDMREVIEIGDLIPGVRAAIKLLVMLEDEIKKSSKRLNRPVNQVLVIFDCQQFSYRQLNSRTVCQGAIEFFRIFEANYPEILKHCFFINTPRIFPIFFALLRPFLSPRTIGKMEFFGPNPAKWQRALLEKIPSELLPPYYGGTFPGSDEYCSNASIWNDGPLPKNYFKADMSQGRNSIFDVSGTLDLKRSNCRKGSCDAPESNFTRTEVPAGSKIELEFPVSKSQLDEESTLLLMWRIKSEGYDIGFQVTFKDEFGLRSEALVDNHRIDAHVTQKEGSMVCDRVGTYAVTFDNTYSKRRKKVILHNVFMKELQN